MEWDAAVGELMQPLEGTRVGLDPTRPPGAPALVACGPALSLDSLLADLRVLRLLGESLAGVTVVEDGHPVGIVPADALRAHLLEFLPDTGLLGPESLDGDLRAPQAMELVCADCGEVNRVLLFVRGSTMCWRGHVLTVDWG
ncbi:helix-turn-helix domain-containing protein [Kitasatospora sp. HPMI-4]|uniref:helix-turn-helix domain-containing protein n=1 Tax=Kitasatospora sp. HPMI-4 TaxID=3448443 RepID=UPI003F1E28BD